MTQDTYRQRLYQFTRKNGENWKECLDRLYHLYNKWTIQCKDQKDYLSLLSQDHLVKIMPRSTSTHVKDKKPTTSKEVAICLMSSMEYGTGITASEMKDQAKEFSNHLKRLRFLQHLKT